MTGRRYFGQQQVVDLLHYLRLLQNRYDDEALLTVLASPFVGVSNDALVLIRATAERRPIFKGIERTLPADLAEDDRRLVRAFLQRYERLVESSTRLSLELLCERILVEHDYDLAVLARRDGQRRYANLRKLARLARSYEELRGPDIEGFIRFVAEQDAVGAPERDAVSEEEGADAVRLLTIHAAKGLEFKVVVVADAGRERSRTDEILCLSDGRFGFKVAHPGTGSRVSTTSYQAVKETQDQAEDAERLRLYYVAMTRAMDRLIVSGSVDRSSERDERTPIGWVLERLGARGGARPRRRVRPGRGRAWQRRRRAADRPLRPAPARGCRRRSAEPPRPTRRASSCSSRARGRRSRPPRRGCASSSRSRRRRSPVVARLSYSAISLYDRCGYRYYAERIVGMRPAPVGAARDGGDGRGGPPPDRDRRRGAPPARARRPGGAGGARCGGARGARARLVSGRLGRRAGADRRASSRSYTGSALAARIAGLDGVRPERPFAFELDGVLVNGRLDVLWLEGERALVLDYKTNALLGRDPAEIVEEEYLTQQVVYAIACLRAGAQRGRGRLPLPRGSGRGRLEGLHGRRCRAARGGPLAPRSRASGRASSGRRRARSPAPAARRSTSSAPGRGSAVRSRLQPRARVRLGRSSLAARAGRALYDVHGNLPALEAVLADPRLRGRGSDRRAAATSSRGRCRRRASICSAATAPRPFRPRECRPQRLEHGEAHGAPGAPRELGPSASPPWPTWPLTIELDVAGGATFCHATPRIGRGDRHAADARRRARGRARSGADAASSSPGTRTCRSTGSPAAAASSSPAASGGPTRACRARSGPCSGTTSSCSEPTTTSSAAAAAIRATAFPDAEDHAATLLEPPPPDEVSAYFESLRGA